jgi:hypothetical protein
MSAVDKERLAKAGIPEWGITSPYPEDEPFIALALQKNPDAIPPFGLEGGGLVADPECRAYLTLRKTPEKCSLYKN